MKKLCPICKHEIPPKQSAGSLCPYCDALIIYVILRGEENDA